MRKDSEDCFTGKRVLLFRAPKEGEADHFEKELNEGGFWCRNIAVLAFNYINLEELSSLIAKADQYSAIVFTSIRAVQATSKAIGLLQEREQGGNDKKARQCLNMRCYVVGGSTCEAAIDAGFSPEGSNSGNAEQLSEFIISDLKKSDKPVFYPCGNLRRDTLSTKLKQAGFTLAELEVYETIKSCHIKQEVEEVKETKGLPDYVVYFSPSGVQYTQDLVANGSLPLQQIKVVAIGPTTEKELVGRQIPVHSTARTPDPAGVLAALKHRPSSDDT